MQRSAVGWAGATAVSVLGGLLLARKRWRRERGRLRMVADHAYRHELINAFTAIEGAAMILEQETSEAERSQLHEMLASEIGHLRDLLDPGRVPVERVALAGGVLSFGAWLPTASADRRKTAGPHA